MAGHSETGEAIALPVDGRSIKARVPAASAQVETGQWADAAVVEFAEEGQMKLV